MMLINRFVFVAVIFSTWTFTMLAGTGDQVSFEHDVMPLLTKYGCNAGACHGASGGRGGFSLSLYGSDPQSDFDAIVLDQKGRRIQRINSRDSLLLRKPTEALEHGGGFVFPPDSESAQTIASWIEQGAIFVPSWTLARLEAVPQRFLGSQVGDSVRVRVVAKDTQGMEHDVTQYAVFVPEDSASVQVDSDRSELTIRRRGRHVVIARYIQSVVPIELIVPLRDATPDVTGEPNNNFIDDAIMDAWRSLGIRPSPITSDAEFMRRVSLDLTGRLPATARTTRWLARTTMDRGQVVDELLQSDEFREYWTYKLAQWLRLRPPGDDLDAARVYHAWIAERVQQGLNFRDFARDLITAIGDSHVIGPTNFYRTAKGPREQAEFFSELFMGSRLRCANCHNHPLDKWNQDDYHGLAAIFSKVHANRIVTMKLDGQVIHPKTHEPAIPKIPGELLPQASSDEPESLSTQNELLKLADWLTEQDNPYFAKAIVNRLWKQLLGRGLVDPVDDFRSTNPATHPELLNRLAQEFVAHEYDLKYTLRTIVMSATYQRQARSLPENQTDVAFYSHATWRPLEPEVLADAMTDVLGVPEQYGDAPLGTRAITLIDPQTASQTLDVLGRCDRQGTCDSGLSATNDLPKMLHQFNGEMVNGRIATRGGRLANALQSGASAREIVANFYRLAYTREPTDSDNEHWLNLYDALTSVEERQRFLEDFVWALLTSREFIHNH
jgi:hypothetical protein